MGDRSSFTQEARNQFNKQHANLLNNKHTTTVKNIQDLQELEKYMFNNLQSLNRSGANSAQEAELRASKLHKSDSNFHVLHVHNDEMDFTHSEPDETFKELVEKTGYGSLSFHQIDGENTRETINHFIETMPCDILAMATHHRSFFGKLFHSSLTKKMVNHSHIPVLTYYK